MATANLRQPHCGSCFRRYLTKSQDFGGMGSVPSMQYLSDDTEVVPSISFEYAARFPFCARCPTS